MPTPTIPKRTVSLGATARNLNGLVAGETPAAAALNSRNSRRDQVGFFMATPGMRVELTIMPARREVSHRRRPLLAPRPGSLPVSLVAQPSGAGMRGGER